MRENRDPRLHTLALRFATLAGGEDRLCHRFLRLVREADVVKLDFVEAEPHRFLRELRRVDPDRVVVRIDPRDPDPIAPQSAAVTILHRPLRLTLGEERILRYDDAGDRVDVVRTKGVEPRPHITR